MCYSLVISVLVSLSPLYHSPYILLLPLFIFILLHFYSLITPTISTEKNIGACDVGKMKPSPVPFIAISQRTGVPPSRILFVGDSFEKDVMGARAAGMCGALLARKDFTTQKVERIEIESVFSSSETVKNDSNGESGIGGGVSKIVEGVERVSSTILSEKLIENKNEDYIVFNNLYPEEIITKIKKYFDNR